MGGVCMLPQLGARRSEIVSFSIHLKKMVPIRTSRTSKLLSAYPGLWVDSNHNQLLTGLAYQFVCSRHWVRISTTQIIRSAEYRLRTQGHVAIGVTVEHIVVEIPGRHVQPVGQRHLDLHIACAK